MDNIEINDEEAGQEKLEADNYDQLTILPSMASIYRKTFSIYKKNIIKSFLMILMAFLGIFIMALISTVLPESLQIVGRSFFIIFVFLSYQIFKLAYARSISEDKGLIESYVFAIKNLPHYLVSNLYAFLTILGSVPLILPAIYFYNSYFLTAYAVASEGQKKTAPAVRSREYVSGYWWETFGVRITALVFVFMVLGLSDTVLGRFELFQTVILSILTFAFILPYFLTLEYALYGELKEKKPYLKSHEVKRASYPTADIFGILGGIIILTLTVFIIMKVPSLLVTYLVNLLALLTAFVF